MGQLKYVLAGALCAFALAWVVSHAMGRGEGDEESSTGNGRSICIYEDGGYALVDAEDYVTSVLTGMMDSSWSDEMLKVMAVVVRTGIYYQMDTRDSGADVYGTGYSQSSRLINESELKEIRYSDAELEKQWGNEYKRVSDRAAAAAAATQGQVITYQGQVIAPACHMVSTGHTVSAEELYGYDIPYLRQVDSDADRLAEDFTSTIIYSEDRMRKTFEKELAETEDSSEDGQEQTDDKTICVTSATTSGFAKTINVFGTELSAETFRDRLGLPSTNIHIDETKEGYRVITVGVGDSLGLSIYGASVLADNKESYTDILEYYYNKVAVTKQ